MSLNESNDFNSGVPAVEQRLMADFARAYVAEQNSQRRWRWVGCLDK